jgi:hypothetical protein
VRPFRVLLAVSAAALVATACGDDSTEPAAGTSPAAASSSAGSDLAALPPKEILAKARTAIKSAESVRVKGGTEAGSASFQIDMRYGTGDKAYGTISSSGQTLELRRDGQTAYLKANAAFWTSAVGAQGAKLLDGKFLKAPLTDARIKDLADFTDKDSFVSEVLDQKGELTKGDTKQIDGKPAIGVIVKTTATESGTVYIATEGEPYPLEVTEAGANNEKGSVTFSEYGQKLEIEIPPADQTIDVAQLGAA